MREFKCHVSDFAIIGDQSAEGDQEPEQFDRYVSTFKANVANRRRYIGPTVVSRLVEDSIQTLKSSSAYLYSNVAAYLLQSI